MLLSGIALVLCVRRRPLGEVFAKALLNGDVSLRGS